MRKWWYLVILALVLCGCRNRSELETVSDVIQTPEKAEPMEVSLYVPEDAALSVMSTQENGSIYFCDNYTLLLHTVPSGDLNKTVMEVSGFMPDQLPIMKTKKANCVGYDFVWSAVGEQGDQVCRCTILDDENYHYVLTAMADAETAGQLAEGEWETIFRSFSLAEPDQVNTD